MTPCVHFNNGLCGVASGLAGVQVPTTHALCKTCSRNKTPFADNEITRGIAVAELHKSKLPIPRTLLGVPELASGPGTELKRLISWFWSPKKRCSRCSDRIRKMNKWGPSVCRKRRWLIIQWLRQSAEKNGLPFSEFAAGALVDLAIANADKKARKSIIKRMHSRNDARWAVAVTTAPRTEPTLEACIDSLRICGWEPIVFAEPESISMVDVHTVWNEQKKGTWHNWLQSSRWCLENTPADWIMTVQDDSLFHPECKKFAESVMWPSEDAGFVSLYTPKHYTIRKDNTVRPVGVNRIVTRSLWGACALIWPREVLQAVINHPVAIGWLGAAPKKVVSVNGVKHKRLRCEIQAIYNKRREDPSMVVNSDTAIGKILNAMHRTMWFVDPSPVQHIARYSSIGHGGNDGRRNAWRIADHDKSLFEQIPIKKKQAIK